MKLIYLALIALVAAMSGCAADDDPGSTDTTWQYTAVGDSLAFGAIAQQGYVPRYATHLEADTGNTVLVRNLSQPGWRSGDLLLAIQNDATFRDAISASDVLTLDIGGNDLAAARGLYLDGSCGGADNQDCLRSAVTSFQANWDAILSGILALRSAQNTILRTMDIYNPFVATDVANGDFAVLNPYLDEVNAHIHNSATAMGFRVAEVHQAFNGPIGEQHPAPLLAVDQFHPNDSGHELIAEELRKVGYAPLD